VRTSNCPSVAGSLSAPLSCWDFPLDESSTELGYGDRTQSWEEEDVEATGDNSSWGFGDRLRLHLAMSSTEAVARFFAIMPPSI
jgi:uncharacterized protein with von Willebrand factor type A (vWA) domain